MSRLPRLSLTPLFLCAAALAIAYLVFTTAHYVVHNYQLHHEESGVRADIARLDADHAQLVAVRDYLKSDEYVTDVARRILGLVRPGETLVVVSGNGQPPAATPTPRLTPAAGGEQWWKELFVAAPVATPQP